MPTASSTLTIGNVAVGFPCVQAALSGYSDYPMRAIARRFGADYTLCEVMLDQFLVSLKDQRKRNRHFLYVGEHEHPVGGQLMGAEPEQFVAGALRRQIGGVDVELLARLAASLRGPVAHLEAKSSPAKAPSSKQEEPA